VLPENGVPIVDGEGIEGDLTQRRLVDPADGHVKTDGDLAAHADGKASGKAPPPVPGAAAKQPASLDTPLASLVDSGSAPAAKAPPPPPAMKPAAATIPPTDRPGKSGVPVRITTDRPAAVESGRFRSDTRYKRRRSKAPIYALLALVVAAGGGFAGFQYMKRERAKRAAAALAAAAASPPIGAGQDVTPPPTTTGAGGGAAAPTEAAGPGTEGAQKVEPTKTPEAQEATPKTPAKTEAQAEEAAKPAKQGTGKSEKGTGEKSARAEEGSTTPTKRRREKAQAAGGETPTPAGTKSEEATAEKEKRTAGEESAKAGEKTGEGAKSGEAKSAEAAKPEGEKASETGKSAEAAAPSVSERPALKITSSPTGADVVIDGVPVGTTPFSSRDVTADGTHAISVKKDGYETHERMISGSDWSRGKSGALSLKVNIKLKRAAGEKPATDTGEKKEKPPEVEILTPSPIE
jgi:hypothetical protein